METLTWARNCANRKLLTCRTVGSAGILQRDGLFRWIDPCQPFCRTVYPEL
jgi:hypothetical protein